jgi:hypothetical protein
MTGFSLGVRDFRYESTRGLLFIVLADMNVASRVDSYLTNMKLPWEKDVNITIMTVGSLECYIQNDKNEFKFDKLWNKTYPSQGICMDWEPKSCRLAVGMDNGTIDILHVSSEINFMKQQEVHHHSLSTLTCLALCRSSQRRFMMGVSWASTSRI